MDTGCQAPALLRMLLESMPFMLHDIIVFENLRFVVPPKKVKPEFSKHSTLGNFTCIFGNGGRRLDGRQRRRKKSTFLISYGYVQFLLTCASAETDEVY